MDDPKKRQIAVPVDKSVESAPPPPAPAQIDLNQFAQVLAAALQSAQPQSALTHDDLAAILSKVGETNALAMKRALNKQNDEYNEISPFTYPEGQLKRPKPKLTRKTFFGPLSFQNDREIIAGWQQHEDQLTPLEIELFNSITSNRVARKGAWKAEIRQTGGDPELHVGVLMQTSDQRLSLPSLVEILMELTSGEKVPTATDLLQQVMDLQRKVEALEGVAA